MPGLFDSVSKMLEVAIRGTVLRHNIIANNISNADTPGYQAMDISFEGLLRRVLSGEVDPERVDMTPKLDYSPLRLAGLDDEKDNGVELILEPGEEVKLDANTVDIDREMTKLAENLIMHNAFVRLLNAKYRILKTAINGRA
ncbi:TPA: flagellar basal body rod protein FlgB [Candidatus Poribacteria bacterium]|nr:flagellar basal body rod protein FlgB [Candidatus Poribacteria bacterium]HEX29875.1 flagellar basal body rod protein FlgB [Candidatus Poribacteria bacterium]